MNSSNLTRQSLFTGLGESYCIGEKLYKDFFATRCIASSVATWVSAYKSEDYKFLKCEKSEIWNSNKVTLPALCGLLLISAWGYISRYYTWISYNTVNSWLGMWVIQMPGCDCLLSRPTTSPTMPYKLKLHLWITFLKLTLRWLTVFFKL